MSTDSFDFFMISEKPIRFFAEGIRTGLERITSAPPRPVASPSFPTGAARGFAAP